jgi:hypothetical protein
MFEVEGIQDWQGQEVLDRDGERIGKLDTVFTDSDDGAASLATVKSGLVSKHVALVPLAGASFGRSHLRVPYPKDLVESAPSAGADGRVTRADELLVARHYGVQPPERDAADDDVRYQPAGVVEARRAAAARAEAEELEAKAAALRAKAEGQTG